MRRKKSPGYYYKKRTKEALTKDQIKKVLAAAKEYGEDYGINVYRLCMVFLYTGMHPWVLYNLKGSRLRRIGDSLQWIRPKKVTVCPIINIPIFHEIKPWIDDFIYSDIPQFRCWIWEVIKKVGLMAGIPELSPMSFRHTFAVMLDDMGFTPAEIQKMLGCSLKTVMRYTSRTQKNIENKFYEQGWIDGEPKKVTTVEHEEENSIEFDSKKKPEFSYHAKFDIEDTIL